jgi:hypothetical protein
MGRRGEKPLRRGGSGGDRGGREREEVEEGRNAWRGSFITFGTCSFLVLNQKAEITT